MMSSTVWVWEVARICLVAMFPFSAIDKLWHRKSALAQTETAGIPGGPALLAAAIGVEAITPICIVSGWFDRPAAVVLAYGDFFGPDDASKGRDHFWEFVKNFGLVGGLLLVVFAGDLTAPIHILPPSAWSSMR